MGKVLLAVFVTVLVVFGITHFLWPDRGEPAQLITAVVVGGVVGGISRFAGTRAGRE